MSQGHRPGDKARWVCADRRLYTMYPNYPVSVWGVSSSPSPLIRLGEESYYAIIARGIPRRIPNAPFRWIRMHNPQTKLGVGDAPACLSPPPPPPPLVYLYQLLVRRCRCLHHADEVRPNKN